MIVIRKLLKTRLYNISYLSVIKNELNFTEHKLKMNKKSQTQMKTDEELALMNDEEWKKILPKDVFHIAREKGTERPFTGKYNKHDEIGMYYCAVCGNPLFKSNAKFNSSCGWPSFFEPVTKDSIIYLPDNSYGMRRTEVQCGKCKSHLGHVFEDGPPPSGLRYCINSVVLDFEKKETNGDG